MKNEKTEKSKAPKAHVSETKKLVVKRIKELSGKYNMMMIMNIMGLPSSQFQQLRKKFKKEAVMEVVKKKLAIKILEEDERTKPLIPSLEQSAAILFSNLDPFELSIKFDEQRSPAKAKPGQIANNDLAIEAGPTDLMAGPALSELSKVGLKVGVEGGKIAVKERKLLVKKGEKISAGIADVLSKLEITPFSVGLEPLAAYDKKSGKVFVSLKINKKEKIGNLKLASVRAIMLAISVGYTAKETISMLIGKAGMQFNKLNSLINQNTTQTQ
ncbi:50S ribosomal protein L10 [Candidatus Pacearchaeota archaeon CG06_land_8_20_14_3_00_35_12]|nr:MAG: 50S ribosomal protein L10 [Candidatus Pacearchaeota archaeon CG06_land_8_20_14_3_00_35_12]